MMRRATLLSLLFALALPVAAAEKWWEAYNRGVASVNSRDYRAGAASLEKAIAEMPNEATNVRQGTTNVFMQVYVPHFFLGIARFNLGDVDGALRELNASENQGVIQKTQYYPQLQNWITRAQSEKQRQADSAAAPAKKAAGAAISLAIQAQGAALDTGGDRTDTFRDATKKLQEALSLSNKAGSDVKAYQRATDTAQQARELFNAAAEQGKRIKSQAPVRTQSQPAQRPLEVVVPFDNTPKPEPKVETKPATPAPAVTTPPVTATASAIESEALVASRVALQSYRRELLAARGHRDASTKAYVDRAIRETEQLQKQLGGRPSDDVSRMIGQRIEIRTADLRTQLARSAAASQPSQQTLARAAAAQLQSAYRKYASGDAAAAETMLSQLLERGALGEAYLLRGCARFTRAMLSRQRDVLLAEARADFRTALRMNANLRLDPKAFSPSLVAFFEQVKSGS